MKKVAIGLVCALLVLTVTMVAMARTIRVPAQQGTIQEAIIVASDGDVIFVAAGDYPGNIVVDKSVKIKGAGAAVTFISALDEENGFMVIASDVTISGFTISGATIFQNSGVIIGGESPGDPNHVGLVSNVTVRKCVLEGNCVGVYIWKSSYNTVVNNVIRYSEELGQNVDGGNGIIVWEGPSTNNRITNNKLYMNFKYGIFVGGSVEADYSGTKISGNNLFRNGAYGDDYNWLGMGFMNVQGVVKVHGNQIFPTDSGLDVWVWNCPELEVWGNPVWQSDSPRIPTPWE